VSAGADVIEQTTSRTTATKRLLVDAVEFAVDPAFGPTIRGRFGRVGGSYEVGAGGTTIELVVDPTSVETGSGFVNGLLHSVDAQRLGDPPLVRFRSTRVRDAGGGALHVEGRIEAGGEVEPVAFDAKVRADDEGRVRVRLEAVTRLDPEQLGRSADRFRFFLPATVHVTARLRP
jgi:polyisoprenoid-binding protein YceI